MVGKLFFFRKYKKGPPGPLAPGVPVTGLTVYNQATLIPDSESSRINNSI